MPLAILLDFDGTAYLGDLAIQAYARRLAELVDADTATWLIGGTRAFLEGKPAPAEMPPAFDTAEDGYELVHALAVSAGVTAENIRRAYLGSRDDLGRSAFALDPQPGLAEWLTGIKPDSVIWLVTNAPLTGVREILDSVGLLPLVDEIVTGAGKPPGMPEIAARALATAGRPTRLVAVGDRWTADLAAPHALGARTAYLDRFGRGFGTPTWRNAELEPLLPALRRWAANPDGDVDAH